MQIYKDRVLAFIDILGFKDMISQSVDNELEQQRILQAMDIIHSYKELNDKWVGKEIFIGDGCQVTTFSDSAVISYPLSYDGALFLLIIDIIHIQIELLRIGILVRGAITIGMAYHDIYNVFGPAMVKAYQLESSAAIYPRIIIHPEIVKLGILNSPSHQNEYDLNLLMNVIKQDYDGYFYVDYLKQSQEFDCPERDYYSWLSGIRRVIVDNLNRFRLYPDLFNKYQWLMNYWNSDISSEKLVVPIADLEYKKESEIQEEIKKYRDLIIDPSIIPYV